MSYLKHLKQTEHDKNCRWIVKYAKNNEENLIREVKLIYKPSEYYASKKENARPLHNKNALIKILENDKARRN